MPRPGYFIVQAMDDNAKAAKVVFGPGPTARSVERGVPAHAGPERARARTGR